MDFEGLGPTDDVIIKVCVLFSSDIFLSNLVIKLRKFIKDKKYYKNDFLIFSAFYVTLNYYINIFKKFCNFPP